MYKLSDKILEFIGDSKLEEISIGCSISDVYKIENKAGKYFLKVGLKGILTNEYNKLICLDGILEVPKVVLYDIEKDTEYLITKSMDGEMLCSYYYKNNPLIGIKVICESFKKLYSIDITKIPYNVSLDYKLSLIENNIKNNLIDEKNISKEVLDRFGSIENIYKYLIENRFDEELVFSHGDMSLPNIFGTKDSFIGFIDIGESGIADKWFDIAICVKSIKRNYGEEYISIFFKELGIIPDNKKIDYYLLIMELFV